MKKSRIIRHKLTKKANKKELDYRNNMQLKESEYSDISNWFKRVNDGRLLVMQGLEKIGIRPKGRILELGAGSCWFASELSKLKQVRQVYALEFSETLLKEISPKIMKYLGAKEEKITRVIGDFNKLEFNDKTFDWVVFDAALHHITDMDQVLQEVRRVLKDGGSILAIREPVLPKLRPGIRETFGAHERSLGVTENIYTKNEWLEFFERNGLRLRFVQLMPREKSLHKIISMLPFRWLNGLLFAHYVFIAKKA
ncbi:MAG: class I SAM-dependent methyltransferase [Candidatus Woesearchaeota archaeon]